MRVGILGTGDVGQTLGSGFLTVGHQVKMGSRNPHQEKVRAWLERTGKQASAGSFAEASAFAEIAVLATLGWDRKRHQIGRSQESCRKDSDRCHKLVGFLGWDASKAGNRAHEFRRRERATVVARIFCSESIQHGG